MNILPCTIYCYVSRVERCHCLIAVLTTNEILVVGGTINAVTITDEAQVVAFTIAEIEK